MLSATLAMVERNLVPDSIIRLGIRRLLRQRLAEERMGSKSEQQARYQSRIAGLRTSAIALVPEKANEQHYELPTAFFERVLGPRLKYSSGLYANGVSSLSEAEEAMLKLTCERAEVHDGHDILELGCGWGSLTLWMAEQYPTARIVAVSNSADQRRFVLKRATERNLTNISVITRDMNDFTTDRTFDRVISVEMFEHMRNYAVLLERIAGWLKADGKLFVHIFCHREYLYPFEARDESDWMARYFFTGGLMPSYDTLLEFQQHVSLANRWAESGTHYAKTSRAWLENMDRYRDEILTLFREVYGLDRASVWFVRWRLFFMACEELFGYTDGEEWLVGHYLFTKASTGK